MAAFVAQDVLDPDGLVRPMLRGAAERLQSSPSRLLCRAGARYLELDPHPVEIIEPGSARVSPGGRPDLDRASLPVHTGATVEADMGAGADAARDAGPGASTVEGREAPPA